MHGIDQQSVAYFSESTGHFAVPTQRSQYLRWAWDGKASSCSSSRPGHTVSSVDSSQYLERARKRSYLFKELLALDDHALGGISKVVDSCSYFFVSNKLRIHGFHDLCVCCTGYLDISCPKYVGTVGTNFPNQFNFCTEYTECTCAS